MTIDGNATTIHHNVTDRNGGEYGLHTHDSSSSIHLVSPLTKEMISTNNNGGRNYCGTIQTITNNLNLWYCGTTSMRCILWNYDNNKNTSMETVPPIKLVKNNKI